MSVSLIVSIIIVLYLLYKKYFLIPLSVDKLGQIVSTLEQLKDSTILNDQDGKKAYFALTLIIKQYLSLRYNNFFNGLTDREILRRAHNLMPEDCIDILREVLQGMVLVKFEHQYAIHEKLEKDIMLIEEFIKKTTLASQTKGI